MRPCPALIIAGAIFCALSSTGTAQVQGDAELLAEVARRHRANRERIVSWQGRITDTYTSLSPGSEQSGTSSIAFFWDVKSQRKRWNWKQESGWTRDGDGPRQPLEKRIDSGMLKDGAYYWLDPASLDRGTPRVIHVYPEQEGLKRAHNPFGTAFDPEYWFGPFGTKVDVQFQHTYDGRDSPGNKNVSVTRRGDIVILEGRHPTNKTIMNRLEVSLSQGGSMVRFVGGDHNVQQEMTWDHEQIAGVWVPKEISIKHVQKSPKHTTTTSTIKWLESIVNEPVTDDAFSFTALGAQAGDFVSDTRSGVMYQISAKDLAEDVPPSGLKSWMWAGLLGLIVPALILGAFLLIRARRRTAGGTV